MQVEISDDLGAAVAALAAERGEDPASLVAELVAEGVKMRRVPGILFADGPTGRRARIGGTGIEVFEVIQFYEYAGRDREQLRRGFDWLKLHQLDAAIAYYEAFPEDIEPRLKTEEEALAELHALWRDFPQTSPDWPGRRRPAEKLVSSTPCSLPRVE